jgi:hypothetical protein
LIWKVYKNYEELEKAAVVGREQLLEIIACVWPLYQLSFWKHQGREDSLPGEWLALAKAAAINQT